jgi:hypothetical protein
MCSVLTILRCFFVVFFAFALIFKKVFSLNLVVAAIYRTNYSLQGPWYINFHLISRPQKHLPLRPTGLDQ